MRAREYSPLQDSLPNRKRARYYRNGPWLPACPGGRWSVIFPERLWGPFPASRSHRKLIESRRHLLSLYRPLLQQGTPTSFAETQVSRSWFYCPAARQPGPDATGPMSPCDLEAFAAMTVLSDPH